MTYTLRRSTGVALLYGCIIVGALFTVLPFAWMLLSSFKSTEEIFRYPPRWLPNTWRLATYQALITERPFGRWYLNSVTLASVTTLAVLFFSSLAGFGFAKYRFRGRVALFAVLIGSTMIPFQLIMIPLFLLISRLGLVNSYAALVVPFMAPAFGIFFMKQFMGHIPNELLDAARIDGSSEFGIYWRVVVPLLKPAFATLAITTFLGAWNSFIWPLIVLRDIQDMTLTVGLATLLATVHRPANRLRPDHGRRGTGVAPRDPPLCCHAALHCCGAYGGLREVVAPTCAPSKICYNTFKGNSVLSTL